MEDSTELHRDMDRSAFADILSHIDGVCPGFLAAVFYDGEGETIDYHSYMEPFDTRLAAAHIGVIAASVARRFAALNFGKVEQIEIHATHLDSVTVSMGDGLFLSVIVAAGHLNQLVYRRIIEVIREIRVEING